MIHRRWRGTAGLLRLGRGGAGGRFRPFWRLCTDTPNKLANPATDAAIARIAANQHGAISLAQLIACGLSRPSVGDRVRAGRLHRIHRGVYAVGHAGLSREGEWMAAVLACDEGAVLSHTSAAMLWGMRKPRNGPVHVTVPSAGGRARREGLKIHRSSTLLPSQTTLRTNIPVTTPTRTLSDLRRLLPASEFRVALRQAEYLRLPIGDQPDADRTRSELERLFLGLCRRHRRPAPEVNVRVGPFLVDFLWPAQRLIVEVDGWDTHRTHSAFEDDRARDVELKLAGYEVVRFTHRQVTREGASVAAALARFLR